MTKQTSALGEWSSHWAFILAATGAAVGLGNIWKFPYIAGENGGGAFVIVYLICITLIGLPLMIGEIIIGRRGRQNPMNAILNLAIEAKRSRIWKWVGLMAILASFLILSYYSVIAGWALEYVFKALSGSFNRLSATEIDLIFNQFTSSSSQLLFWHSVIMLSTTLVVAMGVEKGLESAVKYMFPAMLVLIMIIIIYSMETGYFAHGFSFLFHPNFSNISGNSILIALGHAFFTLSLATGSIMMYGAYLPQHAKIAHAGFCIALADTLIALMAGLAIFPIVFANHLTPSAGPGLIFVTLPIAFGSMPYGQIIGTLFFVMLVLAAFTSSISLLEPSVAWVIERYHVSRLKSAMGCGFLVWLVGLGSVFSFNTHGHHTFFGLNFFEAIDYLTANIMLPLGGLMTAIFLAWRFPLRLSAEELECDESSKIIIWLQLSLGVITPIAIAVIFLHAIKII